MRTAPRPRPKRVTFAAFLALGVMLAAVSISVGSVPEGGRLPEAGAQTAKAVTVTPAAAMAGEKVTVRWSGFTPGAPVSIFQCATAPLVSWKSSCAEPTWTGGVTGPDGTGSAEFLVWQYTLPGLGSNPALFCGETGCGVVVTECDTELTPGLFAVADLGVPYGGTNPVGGGDEELEGAALAEPVAAASAEAPTTATAAETATALPHVGAAAAATRGIRVQAGQAMDPVLPDLADALNAEGINLDSTVNSSPESIDSYIAGKTDLALTARPLSAEQQAQLRADGRPTLMVPIAVSPLVIIHNMDVRGVPIQRFRMSVDTVAKVYRGLIVGVEAPELRADNGGCGITTSGRTTDRSILGFFRTGRSAANYTFSKWLTTAAKDGTGQALWPPLVADGKPAEAPSEMIPNAATGMSKTSNRDLAEFLRIGTLPGASGVVYTNDAGRLRVGFVDMSAAVELIEEAPAPTKPGLYPIRGVEISNASGKWVSPTPASVNATLAESTIRADHSVDVNVRATAPDAYPLVSVVYALVPAAPVGAYDAQKATTGKDLIEFLLSDDGQSILEEAGFVRLSGELGETADETLSEISTVAVPATTTTTIAPAAEEFVLGSSDLSGGDYGGGGFDQLGGDGSTSDDGFAEEAGSADGDGSGEEATGDATIETSASLLERAAGAPALLAVLLLGAVALTVGQVLKRADRRRRASGAA